MFNTKKFLHRRTKLSLLLSLGFAAILLLGQIDAAFGASAPDLGTAEDFAVLAGSTVTNTGSSVILRGNVGVSPGSAVTGFPPGAVTPPYTIHAADAVAAQAQIDLTTAYNYVAGQACNTDLTGQDLGGLTLTPGVYCFSTAAQLTGTLTLDALGNSGAVFIFQIGSTLTTATNSTVNLINGALSRNVFWQVGTSATLGTTSTFAGDILALTSITLNTGANMSGRVLARNGAVTLDGNAISVPCPLITLLPTVLPTGTVNAAYSQTITASGGLAPYTFTMTAGTLPTGLSPITAGGVIAGTPTAAGTFTFTITATDDNGCTGLREYTLVINPAACPPITLLPTILPAGTVNSAYSQTITASGGAGPYAFTMTSGALPTGLSPITTGGVIAGTPTTAGTFTFTITATDDNGCTGLREYTLVINPAACPPITLLPTVLPAGTVNTPYNQTITGSGGAAPYSFTMTAGTLPTGLSPITAGGVIAGTPTTAGTFTFTITATDDNGCTGLREYTLVINPAACPPITLLPTILPAGTVNTTYNQTITGNGGAAPYSFTMTAGTLPTGLSPITAGGVIAGTPTTAGTFTFTITATDDNGCTGLREYTLVINPAACPPITLLPTILPAGTVNTAYSQTITASGGVAPYSFTMTAGTLPTGLSPITTGGLIAGTPTTAGTFTFTITATDDNGCTGLREYTLVINPAACPPITLLPTVLPAGTVNTPYNQTITSNGGAAPYSFTMTAGTLPAGLSPITAGGVIAGTPTTAGTFTFTITATDDNGCTGLREYTLVINPAACPPITLLPTVLPAGTVNTPYNQTITGNGGAAPYSFTMTSGSFPTGLSPITAGGVIAGTPTTAGTFTFTVTATDDNGCAGLRLYTIVINAGAVGTIPTLSEWGMIIFMTLLGLTSIYYLRRRKVKI